MLDTNVNIKFCITSSSELETGAVNNGTIYCSVDGTVLALDWQNTRYYLPQIVPVINDTAYSSMLKIANYFYYIISTNILYFYDGTNSVQVNTGGGSALPPVTTADNDMVLTVVNGAWAKKMPTIVYVGSAEPTNSIGNNGDVYLQQ